MSSAAVLSEWEAALPACRQEMRALGSCLAMRCSQEMASNGDALWGMFAAVASRTPRVPAPPVKRLGQFRGRLVGRRGSSEDEIFFDRTMVVSRPMEGDRFGETDVTIGVLFPFEPNDGSNISAFAATPQRLRDSQLLRANDFRWDPGKGLLVPHGPTEVTRAPWFWDANGEIRVPSETTVPVFGDAYGNREGDMGVTITYEGKVERVFVRPEIYAQILAGDQHFRLAYAIAASMPDAPTDRALSPPVVLITSYAGSPESGVSAAVGTALGSHAETWATSGPVTVAGNGIARIAAAQPYRRYLSRGAP